MEENSASRTLAEVMAVLHKNDVPLDAASRAWVGAAYTEAAGGPSMTAFWHPESWDVRDDLFLISALATDAALGAVRLPSQSERLTMLSVAATLQLKMNLQAVSSLDVLVAQHSYADAYAVLRAAISRLNLFLLFSLQPSLYDRWLKHPRDELFLDGHVRETLCGQDIHVPTHLYEMASEIIHGHIEALGEIGLFDKGVFPESLSVRHNVFTAAKFVLGAWWHAVLSVVRLEFRGRKVPEEYVEHEKAHARFVNDRLAPNSALNLSTFIAQERHWEKQGKEKWLIGGSYNPEAFRAKLGKFHPVSGQRARLPKKYDNVKSASG